MIFLPLNVTVPPAERLLAAVIPVKGAAFLITPKFEEERAMEQARLGPLGREAEVMAWMTQPGIPAFAPQTVSPRFAAVDAAREAWLKRRTAARELQVSAWTTQEWVYFLEGMPAELPGERMVELDQAFRFTGTGNGEIAQRWYPLAERSGYAEARAEMGKFLERVGRRKLIMPTYKALVETSGGLAFLDGWRGFIIAQTAASYAVYKRMRYYEMQRNPASIDAAHAKLAKHGLEH